MSGQGEPAAAMPAEGAEVAVGSRNPIKVAAVAEVVAALLPGAVVRGVEVNSQVPDQPRSDEETLRGAEVRAAAALAAGAAFGVGVESGVHRVAARLYGFTWAAVVDARGRWGRGCSARFPIPPRVADHLEQGAELEEAIRRVTGVAGAGRAEGAMGMVTGGRVTRQAAASQALFFAFAPWVRPDLYDEA